MNDTITGMEARGQRELTQSSQLPREGFYESSQATVLGLRDGQELARQLGIKVVAEGSDPLFLDVELPTGFKIQPTDHSMWSHLLDAKGKKIASIFYKAAFYDRRAFMRWGS